MVLIIYYIFHVLKNKAKWLMSLKNLSPAGKKYSL